ncbi:MAG: Alpha-D-glucose 1-phosphate phosphatase YihX [Chlamydiae bacterium]|nr:Alpha-D-glucose 1-phosphate phosphatase YihX [Chlamydiota bacterium]
MRYLWLLVLFCSILIAAPPKVVVFDYGGVVARVNRKPVIEFLSESLGKSYRKVKKDFAREKLYHAFNEPTSYWEKYANHSLPQSWFDSLKVYKKAMIREVPEMRDVILEIKMQGIQVALLSNTTKYRAHFIESMGGYDLFDPILLSCYLGVSKPNPKIYRRLLQSLLWDAKDTVFIDNKKENVEASRKFGIDGIHFESVEKLKNDLRKREINF